MPKQNIGILAYRRATTLFTLAVAGIVAVIANKSNNPENEKSAPVTPAPLKADANLTQLEQPSTPAPKIPTREEVLKGIETKISFFSALIESEKYMPPQQRSINLEITAIQKDMMERLKDIMIARKDVPVLDIISLEMQITSLDIMAKGPMGQQNGQLTINELVRSLQRLESGGPSRGF